MSYYVYILFSKSTKTFYKGSTNEYLDRINRHNNGEEISTKHGSPWILIWETEKQTRSEAIILEKKLKNLSCERTIQFILKYIDDIKVDEGFLKENL